VNRAIVTLMLSLLTWPALADQAASVAVETAAPRQGVVPELVTAYGSAAPALDGGMTLSVQQEGRVLAIAVTPGETVRSGERLLDFGASAAAMSAYQQAVSGVTAARQQRDHTAQMLAQQLATRDQLAQAEKAVTDAQATLDALRREGSDRSSQTVAAPFDGIIATIPVAQGDRVQPGVTLMTITRLDGLVVTVGIEPGARAKVRAGETVHLVPLAGGTELDGQVLRVDGVLNARTRLVDADVSVPPGSVISGAAFRADIKVGELNGWIVPHDAVLNDADGSYLFQVAGTTASRVPVKLAGAAGTDDVVQGALDPGRPIVVQGNYQLSDKTVIRVSDASAPSTGDTPARSAADAPAPSRGGAQAHPAGGAQAHPANDAPARSANDAPAPSAGGAQAHPANDAPARSANDAPARSAGNAQ
jgi:membrane fusion protein (multidrug efflux system)